jgi:hypothetical protein
MTEPRQLGCSGGTTQETWGTTHPIAHGSGFVTEFLQLRAPSAPESACLIRQNACVREIFPRPLWRAVWVGVCVKRASAMQSILLCLFLAPLEVPVFVTSEARACVTNPFWYDWFRVRSRMCGTEAKHSMPAAQVVTRVHLREEKCFARGVFFLAKWQNTVLISVLRKQIRAIWSFASFAPDAPCMPGSSAFQSPERSATGYMLDRALGLFA